MASEDPKAFRPFVPASESPPEFTAAPVVVGTLLGIVFGASSMYLVLKVGLTVSASIPVAVLSFALFRVLSGAFGLRKRSVLENNISQTAGSAGESIAFGVGLVMPALLVLGFDIDVVRVMTVGVLGGLLGILMMIPLRRAFIVNKHGELKYPEGTACADVLKAGEQGGSSAGTLVVGLVIGFVYQFAVVGLKLFKDVAGFTLDKMGLKGGAVGSEMSAPLLGVGFIIGPRIASIMVAGGVLAYLVLVPTIVYFGDSLAEPLAPAVSEVKDGKDVGLIKNMTPGQIRNNYILYIGAGAVATGGIISMIQALPVIVGSVVAGFRDLRGRRNGNGNGTGTGAAAVPRTERDLPMSVVVFGSLGMIVALAAAPQLGLGLNLAGITGAVMILFFGFLFVTVSSRLTGEIGSSSNPISGMTVATLLLTCLILLVMSESGLIQIGKEVKLLALTIAGVVCIASSNGGTTSQALKTGHLLGATPRNQQYAILIASLMSALVVGFVLIKLNEAGTIYTKQNLPAAKVDVSQLTDTDHVRRGDYASDTTEYKVLVLGDRETIRPTLLTDGKPEDVKPGRYLIAADGSFAYLCDPAVNGKLKADDDGTKVTYKFDAPKTQLVALIIDGILDRKLPWGLVIIGALIALTVHLCGVSALAFAVGVYLPLSSSVPIFIGGMVRSLVDRVRNKPEEGDSSPGVLLGSGYIAGGSLAALAAAALEFDSFKPIKEALNLSHRVYGTEEPESDLNVTIAFAVLALVLTVVGVTAGRKK